MAYDARIALYFLRRSIGYPYRNIQTEHTLCLLTGKHDHHVTDFGMSVGNKSQSNMNREPEQPITDLAVSEEKSSETILSSESFDLMSTKASCFRPGSCS